jgi:pimeloyl-ACP methyl ester carboxylesterase
MIQKKLNIIIEGKHGKPILADVYYKASGAAKPVVVFSHGFKGFKDWGCWHLIAEEFAKQGFVFLKFNFSHNGTRPGKTMEFADLEAFGNNNFTKELDDLGSVLDWLESSKELKEEINFSDLFLIGHSRGGGISIIKAKEDARVKKLATWASVANFERLFPANIDEWRMNGEVFSLNSRTGQKMPLYYQLYENFIRNKERLNIVEAAAQLAIPVFIIHGSLDEAVPPRHAQQLQECIKNAEVLMIEGGGHTFGMKHPCSDQLPREAAAMAERTIAFFSE